MSESAAKKAKVEALDIQLPLDSQGVSVVLGAQWGDEGKGKLVDILAGGADIVARCAGGNNAGHTLVVGGVKYDFHVVPSGIISKNATSIIGNGVVVHLEQMFAEIEHNIECDVKGGATNMEGWESRLLVSDRAHVVLDLHQTIDGLLEKEKGAAKIGTTNRGIGPVYAAKASRIGFRVCELYDTPEVFEAKFRSLVANYQKRHADLEVDIPTQLVKMQALAARLKPMVIDTIPYIHAAFGTKKILVEGANATMLDLDMGTYPYVTSSNCTIGGVCTGLGLPPRKVKHVYGVCKAYSTRVGGGGFPSELHCELGTKLQDIGHEYGVTTGRKRRCGWLDLVVMKHSCLVNGYSSLMLTKLDVLDSFVELKICTGYKYKGELLPGCPANAKWLDEIEVVYDTVPGWNTDITGIRDPVDLPAAAKAYIKYIEDFLDVPIQWVGVGPDREASLRRF